MTEKAEEVSPVVSRSLHVPPHSLVVVVVVVVACFPAGTALAPPRVGELVRIRPSKKLLISILVNALQCMFLLFGEPLLVATRCQGTALIPLQRSSCLSSKHAIAYNLSKLSPLKSRISRLNFEILQNNVSPTAV